MKDSHRFWYEVRNPIGSQRVSSEETGKVLGRVENEIKFLAGCNRAANFSPAREALAEGRELRSRIAVSECRDFAPVWERAREAQDIARRLVLDQLADDISGAVKRLPSRMDGEATRILNHRGELLQREFSQALRGLVSLREETWSILQRMHRVPLTASIGEIAVSHHF